MPFVRRHYRNDTEISMDDPRLIKCINQNVCRTRYCEWKYPYKLAHLATEYRLTMSNDEPGTWFIDNDRHATASCSDEIAINRIMHCGMESGNLVRLGERIKE